MNAKENEIKRLDMIFFIWIFYYFKLKDLVNVRRDEKKNKKTLN